MLRRAVLGAAVSFFLVTSAAAQERSRTVRGVVHAAADSATLSSVRVHVLGTNAEAITDELGRFELRRVPRGTARLVFRGLGLRVDTVAVAPDVSAIRVYLHASAVLLPPVIAQAVAPERLRFETIAQTSIVELDATIIKEVPAIAEPDVARVVQLLPGVTTKNDFSTGLVVRGGESDQALIRLDKVLVFNPTHIGGLFSTFDANAIEGATVSTGGFPARYGGRLSSVLDVSLRDGRRDRFGVSGAISILSGKALVEGPLGGNGSFMVAARRSYADELADTFVDDEFTYWFGDALARVSNRLPLLGQAALTAYWGRDRLTFPWFEATEDQPGTDFELEWGNRLLGLQLRQGTDRLALEEHVSVTEFDASLGYVPNVYQFTNAARLTTAQIVLSSEFGAGHRIELGGGYEGYRLDYRSEDLALERVILDQPYNPDVWSGFLDQQWRIGRIALLRPGVRLEYVSGAEETTVSPRASAKIFLTSDLALTGSAGRYRQAVQSLRNYELPLVVFDVWIGADQYTPVAESDHFIGGVEFWPTETMSVTVEGYHKTFENLLVNNPFSDPNTPGDEFDSSSGWADGVDVLIRRHGRRFRGWIAYSYAKALRYTATGTFPPAHDRRHSVDIVAELPGPLGARLGVRWGFGSPLPYTEVVGEWVHRRFNPNRGVWDYAAREALSLDINGARYPSYHRLDLSLRWEVEKWGGILRPYLHVINAYDRRNVFVYWFDYRTVPPTRSGYSQLPIVPTVGVEFEW